MNPGVAGQPVSARHEPVAFLCWQIAAALLYSGILSAPSQPEPSSVIAIPPPPARSPGMTPAQALEVLVSPPAPPAAWVSRACWGPPVGTAVGVLASHTGRVSCLPFQPWPLGILYHEPLLLPASEGHHCGELRVPTWGSDPVSQEMGPGKQALPPPGNAAALTSSRPRGPHWPALWLLGGMTFPPSSRPALPRWSR